MTYDHKSNTQNRHTHTHTHTEMDKVKSIGKMTDLPKNCVCVSVLLSFSQVMSW